MSFNHWLYLDRENETEQSENARSAKADKSGLGVVAVNGLNTF
jgi:hypothetical protein